ncbi:hypothetical protein BX666DRAFT_2027387 [Dichotomocladium elegans]|nr:hypothetical protein BX666DRAFT_2027387 [Dichotomocladium elegans]
MLLAEILHANPEDLPQLATFVEWFDLLDRSEAEEGYSIKTKLQKQIQEVRARPGNREIEMSPEDFMALIRRLWQDAQLEASNRSDISSVDGSLAIGNKAPTMTSADRMNSHQRNGTSSLSPAPKPQRPTASSSLDHRQRTSELLNQVHARLHRITDRSQDSDNDDHRLTPSIGHPSLSPSSSVTDLYTGYAHQQHRHLRQEQQQQQQQEREQGLEDEQQRQKQRTISFLSSNKDHRKSAELTQNENLIIMDDVRSTSSFLDQRNVKLVSRKLVVDRIDKMTQDYEDQIAKMEVMLSEMRHENIMYKRALSDCKTTEKDQEKIIAELEQRLEEATQMASRQATIIENLRGDLKMQKKDSKHLKEILAQKEDDLKHAERKNEHLENNAKVYQKELEEKSQTCELLENKIKDVNELELQIEELTIENGRLNGIIDDLKTDSDDARQGLTHGRKPIQTLDAELAGTMDDFNNMDPRIDQLQRECDLYRTKAEEAVEELDKLRSIQTRSQQLEKDGEKYKFEKEQAFAKLEKFERLCAQLQEENEKLSQYASELEQGLHNPTFQGIPPTTADIAVQSDMLEAGSPETYAIIHKLKKEVEAHKEAVSRLKTEQTNKYKNIRSEFIVLFYAGLILTHCFVVISYDRQCNADFDNCLFHVSNPGAPLQLTI